MNEVTRLFQAFLAPAIIVSATGLLILSINVRLMGMVTRLRHFVHARYDASRCNRRQEAEAYDTQIESIEKRAETIRRSFMFSLISLAATITSCLLLGLGLYFTSAALAAALAFVVALICLLVAVLYYLREVMDALSSVHDEQRDLRFMDLGARPEPQHRDAL
jgi:cation transport ATPase